MESALDVATEPSGVAPEIKLEDVSAGLGGGSSGASPAALQSLRRPSVVAIPDGFMVWGDREGPTSGSNEDPAFSETAGAVFVTASKSWRPVAPSPLSARVGQTELWTGKEVVIAGGESGAGTSDVGSEVAAYSPDQDSWRILDPLPEPRSDATGLFVAERIVLAGGSTATSGQFSSKVLVESKRGGWSEADVLHPVVGAVELADERIVVVGYDNEVAKRNLLHVSLVDPGTMEIIRLPDLTPSFDQFAFSVGLGTRDDTIVVAIGADHIVEFYALPVDDRSWTKFGENNAGYRILGRNRYSAAADGGFLVRDTTMLSITPHHLYVFDRITTELLDMAEVAERCEDATTFGFSDHQMLFWIDSSCSTGHRAFLADIAFE
jgi:hypothetical protein